MPTHYERIEMIFKYLSSGRVTLKDREDELVWSLFKYFERNKTLSERQLEVLEDIYSRY